MVDSAGATGFNLHIVGASVRHHHHAQRLRRHQSAGLDVRLHLRGSLRNGAPDVNDNQLDADGPHMTFADQMPYAGRLCETMDIPRL